MAVVLVEVKIKRFSSIQVYVMDESVFQWIGSPRPKSKNLRTRKLNYGSIYIATSAKYIDILQIGSTLFYLKLRQLSLQIRTNVGEATTNLGKIY